MTEIYDDAVFSYSVPGSSSFACLKLKLKLECIAFLSCSPDYGVSG